MIARNYLTLAWFYSGALALMMPIGCGDDPSMYRGETLTFESPVSAKATQSKSNKTAELDLSTDEASDFLFTRFGVLGPTPWVYPLYNYYLEPIPLEVPVSPFYSVVEYAPPMYFDYYFNPFFWDDEDDRNFRSNDDDNHHSRSDDDR
jgi:hypothetical protein